jgi:hypothetical protein
MLTDRGWLETTLALVYFGILEALSWETSKFPPCILASNEAGGQNQAGNQACATMHEAVFRLVAFIWDNASHDNVLAFGTVCIAVFTYVLYRATNKLWDAGERQLAHFEQTARRQLRAYMSIVGGGITINGSVLSAGLRIKNTGQTPASNVTTYTHVGITNDISIMDFAVIRDNAASNGLIGPGHDMATGNRIDIGPDLANFLNGTMLLFAWGQIEYTDAFGSQWTQDFRYCGAPLTNGAWSLQPEPQGNEERETTSSL